MKLLHKSLLDPMPHGEWGNPQEILKSLLSQKRTTGGSPKQTLVTEKWTRRPDHGACRLLAFEIRSYLLAHAYNRNLNDQEGNTTYLSPSRRCRRMVLQPPLKVSVPDTSIFNSNVSIGPCLMWWEPWPQTMPPSVKLQLDLTPKKVIIYVYKDVLSLHLSSKGPPPSN